jgi:hypothetical protein
MIAPFPLAVTVARTLAKSINEASGFCKAVPSPDESSTRPLPPKHRAAPLEMVVTIRPILSTLAPACRSSRAFHTGSTPKCDEALGATSTPKTNDNVCEQSSLSVCRPMGLLTLTGGFLRENPFLQPTGPTRNISDEVIQIGDDNFWERAEPFGKRFAIANLTLRLLP